MSALLKAIGVYLGIVVPLVAWIGGTIWAIATDNPVAPLIAFAPIWLFLVAAAIWYSVILPIDTLFNHYKKKEGRK